MKSISTVRRLIIAAALSTTIPLTSSCAAITAVPTAVDVLANANKPADKVFNTLADEKAYYGLLAFEADANKLASTAVDLGFLKPGSPTAIKVADLLLELTKVTTAAKAAKTANDAVTLSAKITAGKDLYQKILTLVKGK